MLALLSLTLMTASANTETAATCAARIPAPLCMNAVHLERRVVTPRVSMGRVTFDGDDLQQYALVEDDTDFRALVPGSTRGYLGGHSPNNVAIMLDGVVLLNHKRLSPLP